MFSDFFKVLKSVFSAFDNGAHSSHGGSLELFASVERVTVFHESAVISTDVIDQGFHFVDVAERDFVVIPVVEDVDEIGVPARSENFRKRQSYCLSVRKCYFGVKQR